MMTSAVRNRVIIRPLWLILGAILAYGSGAAAQDAAKAPESSATTRQSARAVPGGPAAPVVIGLDADMSRGTAQSGEAIRRGAILAIDEINAAGGVLGRPLALVVRDHRGIPARGIDNILEFAQMSDLVAVIGGLHTPVALAELDVLHEHRIPYLGPWAAGTQLVENKRNPNYVFRVSVRDEHAGGFLIGAAMKRGFKRPGLLLWRTGWGRSNEVAMKAAMSKAGIEPAAITWFDAGQQDMTREIQALIDAGADVVMLVANPDEGAAALRNMAALPQERRLPVISHWGITGGDFYAAARDSIEKLDLTFLQTYSFFAPPFPDRASQLLHSYCATFGACGSPANVTSPVGTAHAYDLVHLLKAAIERAGTIDRPRVRDALERLGRHDGLVRVYDPPFTATRHDALDAGDFRLCRYDPSGAIVPVQTQ